MKVINCLDASAEISPARRGGAALFSPAHTRRKRGRTAAHPVSPDSLFFSGTGIRESFPQQVVPPDGSRNHIRAAGKKAAQSIVRFRVPCIIAAAGCAFGFACWKSGAYLNILPTAQRLALSDAVLVDGEVRAGSELLQALAPPDTALADGEAARFPPSSADGTEAQEDAPREDAQTPEPPSKAVSYAAYSVRQGDTLSGIAKKFSLAHISTLISTNDIRNARALRAGQTLRIPSADGIVYRVKKGDNLSGIAARHKIAYAQILDANALSSEMIRAGQTLFLPGATLDSESLRKAAGELFVSPLAASWRLASPFGLRADPFTGVQSRHTGIDMAAKSGTPIRAAMSGKVAAEGYSRVFGNYVIISHGNGYQTLYGHLRERALVRSGQSVGQGARIGFVGSTGYSTGPHLHFSVYKNGKLIDPQSVLKR
jgi:murein DD-endopeptidase MepM/ murein hydrolase activator NlpD